MATKKQTTDKNSKTKTVESGKPSRPKNSSDFSKTYIELRTVLDALEIAALRYCLMEKDEAARIKCSEEAIKLLLPMVQKFQPESQSGGNCPDGFWLCSGVCVCYPCP